MTASDKIPNEGYFEPIEQIDPLLGNPDPIATPEPVEVEADVNEAAPVPSVSADNKSAKPGKATIISTVSIIVILMIVSGILSILLISLSTLVFYQQAR